MASSSESGGGSGMENISRKELKILPIGATSRRGSEEELSDDNQVPPTVVTEEKVGFEGVSSSEIFAVGLESFFNQEEKGTESVQDAGDFSTKAGEDNTEPSVPGSKENIFRKELKNLVVGSTSRRNSREMMTVDGQVPLTEEVEEMVEFQGVTTTGEHVTELDVLKETVEVEDGGESLTKAEPPTPDVTTPSKETIYRKELKSLKIETNDNVEVVKEVVHPLPVTSVEAKSEFKGVSSIVGSVTELKSVAISLEKVKVQDITECLTRIEPETIHEDLVPVLKTVQEGQQDDGGPVLKRERKSKSLSTGSIEMKAKTPVGELGSSFDRKRKRSHVPLTVLERMEKDPIVAQHFAQLESPTAETISDFADGSKRLLNTTNRLRRTTDSVGLKYVNQYIVIKVLGCGTYGKVKLCLNTMDCKLYAVKIVHRKWLTRRSIGGTTENVGPGAMREIAIMKKLNHPNIVALHEVIDDPSERKLYLVLEYVEGGPILGNEKWRPFPEGKARSFFRDMCQGIDYLHFNKVVHRDLKPGNLLQTLDGKIKISDFGVSHMFEQESDSMHDTAGTPAFLAPEICSGGECQGRPADLWSLGVCLYVMVFGKIPFPAESITEMYQSIIHKEGTTAGVLCKDQNLKSFEGYTDSYSYEGSQSENTASWNHAT